MTQWWLVRIRPSPETNEAEQPCRRTAALRTRSSHDWSMRVPYLSLTVWIGKLSNVHMPSSARADVAGALTRIVAMPEGGQRGGEGKEAAKRHMALPARKARRLASVIV